MNSTNSQETFSFKCGVGLIEEASLVKGEGKMGPENSVQEIHFPRTESV